MDATPSALPKLATKHVELYLSAKPDGTLRLNTHNQPLRHTTNHAPTIDHAAAAQLLRPDADAPPRRAGKKKQVDTAGANWAEMRAPALTPELKRELDVLKMRGALDPKRFYRSSGSKEAPKYFQVGTIVEGVGERRLTNKERKRTMFGELLSDDALRARARAKFRKVQRATMSGVKKTSKGAKKARPRASTRSKR